MMTELNNDQILEVRSSQTFAVLASLKFLFLSLLFFFFAESSPSYKIPYTTPLFSFLGIAILGIGLYHYYYIRCIVYIISHDQIKTMSGVFSRRIDFLEMYRIKDYIVTQPFLFRILNIMNFTLLSIDKNTQNKVIIMKGISVTLLPDKIRDLVQAARQRNRVYEVDNGQI